jgi:hypothetical protein
VLAGGGLLWKRELGSGPQLYGQLAVAPLNSRQLCLCGSSGSLVVLQLSDPARDKVPMQQYRVNTQAAGGSSQLQQLQQLKCHFPNNLALQVFLIQSYLGVRGQAGTLPQQLNFHRMPAEAEHQLV